MFNHHRQEEVEDNTPKDQISFRLELQMAIEFKLLQIRYMLLMEIQETFVLHNKHKD
jgi:hypothetical protein